MPIVDADLVFRQSERMTDFPDGGGRMSTVVVVDGVKNNLFPDITDVDRLTGRVSLRKVFAAALNADTDTLLSAHVLLDVPPVDAATSAVIFSLSGALGYDPPLSSARAQAEQFVGGGRPASATLQIGSYIGGGSFSSVSATWTGGGTSLTLSNFFPGPSGGTWAAVPVGRVVSVNLGGVRSVHTVNTPATGGAAAPGTETIVLTVTEPLPGSGAQSGTVVYPNLDGGYRFRGVAVAPGVTGSGASSITVSSTWARIMPVAAAAAYPTAENAAFGIGGVLSWANTHGLTPVIMSGDALLIHHTATIGPSNVSNGQTIDTLRTALARLRIIGNNGVEHYRATRGQAPVGSGATADLDAGTVTITNVAGFSQPVTIEHRIEELGLATTVTLTTIGLNNALTRSYPAGTRVSSLLMSGDLQGRALNGFAQTAWTGVWADSVSGGTPLGDYNEASYPVTTTNAGAVTERWAVIFTSTQAFRVVGEDLGEIGTGTTQAEYAPLNPATGQPYFRIPALGWGSGWAAGNVYRFNTIGSNTPVWALRCVGGPT